MILEDSEVQDRIDSPLNLMNRLDKASNVTVLPMKVNPKVEEIPSRVKQLLGIITNKSDETQKEIGEVFDVTQVSLSTYSRGLIGERKDEELTRVIEQARSGEIKKELSIEDKAHDQALDCMLECIIGVKSRLTEVDNPTKLSKIATDMSKIVSSLKPKDKAGDTNNTQVVIFAPQQKSESFYDSVTA